MNKNTIARNSGLEAAEAEFVLKLGAKFRAKYPNMDPDFTARQIVDDAYRAGINIQFKQHIVEFLIQKGII
jgi:hypothetical protein